MKTIAIATFHSANNYGAVLQAYALMKFIQNLGYGCYIIDYRPERFQGMYYVSCKRSIRHPGLRYSFEKLRNLRAINGRNRNFENFRHRYMNLGKYVGDNAMVIKNIDIPADIYLAGSDQVWNDKCADFDPFYFLAVPAMKNKKKISYAASFNFEDIPIGLEDMYRGRLSDFEYISVRENSGIKIVSNLVGKNATVCCDPTLLLKSEWDCMAGEPSEKEDYILVYFVLDNKNLLKKAYELQKKKHMKVIVIPGVLSNRYIKGIDEKNYGFEVDNTCSPDRFISLIKYASYVITDSFHGTVFSIIFHKKFWVQTNWQGKRNIRIINLLNQLGVSHKSIDDVNKIDDAVVDWALIDKKLDDEKNNALQYIRDAFL